MPGPHAGHQPMKAATAGLIAEKGPAYEPGEFVRTWAPGCGKYCSAKTGTAPAGLAW